MQKIKITSQLILRYSGNRQTDGRTRPIALHSPLTRSVITRAPVSLIYIHRLWCRPGNRVLSGRDLKIMVLTGYRCWLYASVFFRSGVITTRTWPFRLFLSTQFYGERVSSHHRLCYPRIHQMPTEASFKILSTTKFCNEVVIRDLDTLMTVPLLCCS